MWSLSVSFTTYVHLPFKPAWFSLATLQNRRLHQQVGGSFVLNAKICVQIKEEKKL